MSRLAYELQINTKDLDVALNKVTNLLKTFESLGVSGEKSVDKILTRLGFLDKKGKLGVITSLEQFQQTGGQVTKILDSITERASNLGKFSIATDPQIKQAAKELFDYYRALVQATEGLIAFSKAGSLMHIKGRGLQWQPLLPIRQGLEQVTEVSRFTNILSRELKALGSLEVEARQLQTRFEKGKIKLEDFLPKSEALRGKIEERRQAVTMVRAELKNAKSLYEDWRSLLATVAGFGPEASNLAVGVSHLISPLEPLIYTKPGVKAPKQTPTAKAETFQEYQTRIGPEPAPERVAFATSGRRWVEQALRFVNGIDDALSKSVDNSLRIVSTGFHEKTSEFAAAGKSRTDKLMTTLERIGLNFQEFLFDPNFTKLLESVAGGQKISTEIASKLKVTRDKSGKVVVGDWLQFLANLEKEAATIIEGYMHEVGLGKGAKPRPGAGPASLRPEVVAVEEYAKLQKMVALEQAYTDALEQRKQKMATASLSTQHERKELLGLRAELEEAIEAQRSYIHSLHTPELQAPAKAIQNIQEGIHSRQAVLRREWDVMSSSGGVQRNVEFMKEVNAQIDIERGRIGEVERERSRTVAWLDQKSAAIKTQTTILRDMEAELGRVTAREQELERLGGGARVSFLDTSLDRRRQVLRDQIAHQQQIYEFFRQGKIATLLPPAEELGREINVRVKQIQQQMPDDIGFQDLLWHDPIKYAQIMGEMVSSDFRNTFAQLHPELAQEYAELQKLQAGAPEVLAKRQAQLLTELPLMQIPNQIRGFINLLSGLFAEPSHELISLTQLLGQFEREIARSPAAISLFGSRAQEVFHHLRPATEEVTGYMRKDWSGSIAEATAKMFEFLGATEGMSPARFTQQRLAITQMFDQFQKVPVQSILNELQVAVDLSGQIAADPTKLDAFQKQLLKVATALETSGIHMDRVRTKAHDLAQQFNPSIPARYALAVQGTWESAGEAPLHFLNKADAAFKAFTSKGAIGSVTGEELEPLYQAWQKVADVVRTYHAEVNRVRTREIGTLWSGKPMLERVPGGEMTEERRQSLRANFEAAWGGFQATWAGLGETMDMVNLVNRTASSFAFLSGNISDVGVNATGILESLRELSTLTTLALRGKLPDDAVPRFNQLLQKLRESTFIYRSEHLPVLQSIEQGYNKIVQAEESYFASMMRHRRLGTGLVGTLLERSGARTAQEPLVPGFTLEEALMGGMHEVPGTGIKIAPMERVLRKVNDAIGFLEEFRVIGDQWKPSAVEALFPGSLDVIRTGLGSIDRIMGGYLPFIIEQFSKTQLLQKSLETAVQRGVMSPAQAQEAFEQSHAVTELALYKPTISTTIPKTLENLQLARKFLVEEQTPELASMVTALDMVSRKLEFVYEMFTRLDKTIQSGAVSTKEFGKLVSTFSESYSKGVSTSYSRLIEAQREFLKGPQAVGAVSELLKLPLGAYGGRGIREALLGLVPGEEGRKVPFVETLKPEQLHGIQVGLGEALVEVGNIADEGVANMIKARIGEAAGIIGTRVRAMGKMGQLPEDAFRDLETGFRSLQKQAYADFIKYIPKGVLEDPKRLAKFTERVEGEPWWYEAERAEFGKVKGPIDDMLKLAEEATGDQIMLMRKNLKRKIKDLNIDLVAAVSGKDVSTAYSNITTRGMVDMINLYTDADKQLGRLLGRAKKGGVGVASVGGWDEIVQNVNKGAKEFAAAERKIPGEISKVTAEKGASLDNQKNMMMQKLMEVMGVLTQGEGQIAGKIAHATKAAKGAGPSLWTVQEEAEAREAEEKAKVLRDEEGTRIPVGKTKKGEQMFIDPLRAVQMSKNYFAELGKQIEVFGTALSTQGTPLNVFTASLQAIQRAARGVINVFATQTEVTPVFDKLVADYQKVVSPEEASKVRPFSEIQRSLNEVHARLKDLVNESAELSKHEGKTVDHAKEQARIREQILFYNQRIVALTREHEGVLRKVVTPEFLREDALKRQLGQVQNIGDAYRVAIAESSTSMGVERLAPLEPLQKGFEMFRRSLTAAAFENLGTAGTLPTGKPAFGLETQLATTADLQTKFLQNTQSFAHAYGSNMAAVIEKTRMFSEAFGFNIPIPEDLLHITEQLSRVRAQLATGTTPQLIETEHRLNAALKAQTETARIYVQDVMQRFGGEQKKLLKTEYGISLEKEMQAGQEAASQFINRLDHLDAIIKAIKSGKHPVLSQIVDEGEVEKLEALPSHVTRLPRMHFIGQTKSELNEMAAFIAKMLGEFHFPPEIHKELVQIQQRIATTNKAVTTTASLWERLTNTVKSARNDFVDLFLYQVRWYSSMLIFWGIFNKVTEGFSALVQAQRDIERATINLREQTGEVVANYHRLELIARTAIFNTMVRLGLDSQQAAEALYQLGSAGLSAREALSAMGPVTDLVVGAQAEMRETVKTVAGLYNVLSGSVSQTSVVLEAAGISVEGYSRHTESAVTQATRFRHIADVLATIFRDHQVEMYELNLGYQYSISSADMAGLSFTELSAILAILNDNMLKGAKAGRAVNDILVGLARQPYEVLAGFREMAVMLSETLPAEKAQRVRAVIEDWSKAKFENKTVFQTLGEMSKLVQATGLDIAVLGRTFENFGIIGGRAFAPMMKYWQDIEIEQLRLQHSAAGVSEVMAERMSNTMERNAQKVSAFIQKSFYELFLMIHKITAFSLESLAKFGTAVSGTSEGVRRSFEADVGVSFWGRMLETAINFAPILLMLGGSVAAFKGLATNTFTAIGAKALGATFSVAALTRAGLGLTGVFAGVAGAVANLSLALSSSPLLTFLIGVALVSLAIGGLSALFRKLTMTVDDFAAEAEKSWADFSSEVSQRNQKIQESINKVSATLKVRREAEEAMQEVANKGVKEPVTEDQVARLRRYGAMVGESREALDKKVTTVGDLSDMYQRLEPLYQKVLDNMKAESTQLDLASSAWVKYRKAIEDAQKAKREAEYMAAKWREKGAETIMGPEGLTFRIPTEPSDRKKAEAMAALNQREAEKQLKSMADAELQKFLTTILGAMEDVDIEERVQKAVALTKGGEQAKGKEELIKIYNDIVGKVVSDQAEFDLLAERLFGVGPSGQDLESWRSKLKELLNSSKALSGFLYMLEKSRGAELGEEATRKAAEEEHRFRLQTLEAKKRLLETQISVAREDLEKAEKEKPISEREVNAITARIRGLESQAMDIDQQRYEEEQRFQAQRYFEGTRVYIAREASIDAENLRRREERNLKIIQSDKQLIELRFKAFESTINHWLYNLYRQSGEQMDLEKMVGLKQAAEVSVDLNKYLKVQKGVDISKFSPEFGAAIAQLAKDFYARFGREMEIVSGYRSKEVQAKMYQDFLAGLRTGPVARPEVSRHPMGEALDVSKETMMLLRQMDLAHYGLENLKRINDEIHIQRRDMSKGVLTSSQQVAQQMKGTLEEIVVFLEVWAPLQPERVRRMTEQFMGGLSKLPEEYATRRLEIMQRLLKVAKVVGVDPEQMFNLFWGPVGSLLESGVIIPEGLIREYFEAFDKRVSQTRSAFVSSHQRREQAQKFIRSYFEIEEYWKPENLPRMFQAVSAIGGAAGLSGRRIYDMMVQFFNPDAIRKILEGNLEMSAEYFETFQDQAKQWLGGNIPIRIYKAWEQALKDTLTSGEELTEKATMNMAKAMQKIPGIELSEAIQTFAKRYHMLAQQRFIGAEDLSTMVKYMQMFGATADEVWKAVGDIAETNIRRMRAEWQKSGKAIGDDVKDWKSAVEAFHQAALKGVADFAQKLRHPLKQLSDQIAEMMESMRSTLEEVLFDFATHQPKTYQEYINKIAETLARTASKNISEMIFREITAGLMSLFGIKGLPNIFEFMFGAGAQLLGIGATPVGEGTAAQGVEQQLLMEQKGEKIAAQFWRSQDVGIKLNQTGLLQQIVINTALTAQAVAASAGSNIGNLIPVSLLGSPSTWNIPGTLGIGNLSIAEGMQAAVPFRLGGLVKPLKLQAGGAAVGAGVAGLSSAMGWLGPIMMFINLIMMLMGMFMGGGSSEKKTTSSLVYKWPGPGTPYKGPQAGPADLPYVKQTGGMIPGFGGGDIVPAMLEPGEFVVNRDTVAMFGPHFFFGLQALAKSGAGGLGMLGNAMQSLKLYGGRTHFQSGGLVPSTKDSEMKITVVNVLDEKSLEQFLNTKKYGNVIVNRVAPRISRRSAGGFHV